MSPRTHTVHLSLLPVAQREHRSRVRNQMRMLIALITTLVIVLAANVARGQDPACSPDVTLRRVEMSHQGRAGAWFDSAVIRCLLGDIEELRVLRERANLFEERRRMSTEHVAFVTEQVRLAVAESERAQGALEAAVRSRREMEEAMDSIWRSPILWVVVGVVIGIGAVVATAQSLP